MSPFYAFKLKRMKERQKKITHTEAEEMQLFVYAIVNYGNRIKEACVERIKCEWKKIIVWNSRYRGSSKAYAHFWRTKTTAFHMEILTIHHRIKVYALNSSFSHSIALSPPFFLLLFFFLNGNYVKFMLGKLA